MEKLRIQDDLYEFVNHEWLEKAVIPADRPTAGGFSDLDIEVEKIMMNEFAEMAKSKQYPNEHLEKAITLYNQFLDVKKRNRDGLKFVLKHLEKIRKLKNINALNKNFKELMLSGIDLPLNIDVHEDMKNSEQHGVFIMGPSTILPDSSYYKEEKKQQKDMMIGLWANMAKMLLAETKLSPEEQEQYLIDTLKFDEIIGSLVKSSEEMSDFVGLYNLYKVGKVASMVKPLKLKKILMDLFGEVPEIVCVGDPRFLKGFKELFNEENFEAFKHWAYVTGLIGFARFGGEKHREISGIYGRALAGIQEMTKIEKFGYQMSQALFSEPVGLYYGEKYFGEEAKKDVVDLTYSIINKYKERVKNNGFLSEATKEKAIKKLSTIKVKMGYPDKVEEVYFKFVVDPEKSLLENILAIHRVKQEDKLSNLQKKVDRSKWLMPGHMINACYNPFANDITFPAGILQAPFYSVKQSRSANLGGIGAVIGHEISHAFDNNGAQFDENGSLNNWWAKEDFKKFNKRTQAMIKEFDGIELPWGRVNGKFIVSENIADNGGMAVTLAIMKDMKDANYEEYFTNWAKVWCLKASEQYLQLILSIDVHAPAVLRANMQPRNFEEWYSTFKVTKKDKMYLAPNKRVIIW